MDAAHVAKKIIAALDIPCEIDGKQLHTTPSVGISLFPDNGEDVDVLMKNADSAMYHAKEKGRNNFQFFSPAMTAAATERLEIERDLRMALRNKEFELHYQPQVCADKGLVRGVEALIRWRHPERGLIPPLKFIPIAEESGVIESIGSWVLEEACRQMAAWRKAGFDLKRVAVNLSAHQLRSSNLVSQVQRAIARFGLAPGHLELEITESVAMENPERAIGQLRALRNSGVELAIDDFGTGYSSLAYLKQLPIHTLKLDRAFVRDIENDANDAAISAASISLAHILGLKVVAEGVETAAQQYFLSTVHRCDLLQGYLFGKPEPAKVLTARWQTSEIMPRIAHPDFAQTG
jgi:EAL domain-containing protein (putative c-di-GMP-specific phosphodiesterase class I)